MSNGPASRPAAFAVVPFGIENAPMRAVNARLGYRPIRDSVGLQGPLAGGGGILPP